MLTTPIKLGILVSAQCASNSHGGNSKRWHHISKFLNAYQDLLSHSELYATYRTANLIRNKWTEAGVSLSGLRLQPVGPDDPDDFEGLVRLAAQVARREINRVLVFQDPRDLEIEKPAAYALLRNCNLSGAKMHINASAHLWALYESNIHGLSILPSDTTYNTCPVETNITLDDCSRVREKVVFIAHDNEKPRMCQFAAHYRNVLKRFPMMATAGTKRAIDIFQKDRVPPWEHLAVEAAGKNPQVAHGPAGGDVVVAEDIFMTYNAVASTSWQNQVFHHILFFVDHKHTQPHEPDIQVLLKTCANPLNAVNLILNSKMAQEWAERYRDTAPQLRSRDAAKRGPEDIVV